MASDQPSSNSKLGGKIIIFETKWLRAEQNLLLISIVSLLSLGMVLSYVLHKMKSHPVSSSEGEEKSEIMIWSEENLYIEDVNGDVWKIQVEKAPHLKGLDKKMLLFDKVSSTKIVFTMGKDEKKKPDFSIEMTDHKYDPFNRDEPATTPGETDPHFHVTSEEIDFMPSISESNKNNVKVNVHDSSQRPNIPDNIRDIRPIDMNNME